MCISTQIRDQVKALVSEDLERALVMAREIPDPWFRCQALSFVALRTQELNARRSLIADAFQAALLLRERNRVVSVSAWPLRVIAESNDAKWTELECKRLLEIMSKEPSPIRRADALEFLIGAAAYGPRYVFELVLSEFRNACLTPLSGGRRNKRGQSQLYGALKVIAFVDPGMIDEYVALIDGPELSVRARSWAESMGSIRQNSFPPHF
ncbi:MAG: hypothetical protein KF886_06315 [Candidatus Hydrogenedentes bacterium]|nr:hypothetical protein [Candidatus Hydrogenedentota bacterium]